MTDLISRADAIKAVASITMSIHLSDVICDKLLALPSADAPKGDLISRQWLLEVYGDYIGDNGEPKYHVPLEVVRQNIKDAPSAEADWIPCNKQIPDELEAVNVTWVNHLAPPYYKHIEDVPFVDTAVYYRGKWYWWDVTVIDILAEYGEDCNAEQIDKDIEVIAWMPLPKPYECGARMKGGDDE